MKLCLLADAGSIHTRRWAVSLSERGHDVTVLSLREADLGPVTAISLAPPRHLGRAGYLAVIRQVTAHLRRVEPDLVHAHYATSYGLLAALSRYRPLVVSVWGSDVIDFPRRSPVHAALLKYNLRCASVVAATSRFLAGEAERYVDREVRLIPFGVDTTLFVPAPESSPRPDGEVTIGVVKALEATYGIDVLIAAFDIVAEHHRNARLLVVGSGSQQRSIETALRRSRFASRTRLLPHVPHPAVPGILRSIDVFAVPSRAEAFGVAAIEASACGLPVVASNVGGLPEVVIDGETGILVPPRDPPALAAALARLVESSELRQRLGGNGRTFAERTYSWARSVDLMERLYGDVLGESPTSIARS